jgi:hypothetical protein
MTRSRTSKHLSRKADVQGLHIVALFEGAKGMLVLVVGFGLLIFKTDTYAICSIEVARPFNSPAPSGAVQKASRNHGLFFVLCPMWATAVS